MRQRLTFLAVIFALCALAPHAPIARAQTDTRPMHVQSRYEPDPSGGMVYRASVSSSDSAAFDDTTLASIDVSDGKPNLWVQPRFTQQTGRCNLVCTRFNARNQATTADTIAVVASGGTVGGLFVPDNTTVFDTAGAQTVRIRVLSLLNGSVSLAVTRH